MKKTDVKAWASAFVSCSSCVISVSEPARPAMVMFCITKECQKRPATVSKETYCRVSMITSHTGKKKKLAKKNWQRARINSITEQVDAHMHVSSSSYDMHVSSISYDMHMSTVSRSKSTHTCMYPPPHMTCMYPPPHMTCICPQYHGASRRTHKDGYKETLCKYVSKETYYSVKRDLLKCQQRPT